MTSTSTSAGSRLRSARSDTTSRFSRPRPARASCARAAASCTATPPRARSSRSGLPCRSPAARRWASRSACARTFGSRSRTGSSTSSTASSRACRRSPTSRSARRPHSPSPRSARPTGSATRRRAPSARSCSPGSTRCSRSPSRSAPLPRSGSRATTSSISPGVSLELFEPWPKRNLITVELRPNERPGARGVLHALRELPDWEAVLLRTTPLIARPAIPRDLAGRVAVRTARDGAARAPLLAETAIFVPGIEGRPRVLLEAQAAGCAIAAPAGVEEQPELAAAADSAPRRGFRPPGARPGGTPGPKRQAARSSTSRLSSTISTAG